MAISVPWLVDAARMATAGTGKQVIVSPGWQNRGQGGLRVLEVVVGHHTATPETAPGDYPSLNVVQNGRAGLVGLLSQLGLGRSGNVYVIGAGLAYHAGASFFAGFLDLNDESIGIEAEDSGDGRWTGDQWFMYPRLVGACLHYMRRGVDRYASHRTVARPAGRKSDPAGISDQWMRDHASTPTPVEADVELTGYDRDVLERISYRVAAMTQFEENLEGRMTGADGVSYTFTEPVEIVTKIKEIQAELAALKGVVAQLVGDGVRLGATGEIVVKAS